MIVRIPIHYLISSFVTVPCILFSKQHKYININVLGYCFLLFQWLALLASNSKTHLQKVIVE